MQLQITTPGSQVTLTSCPFSIVSRKQLGSCRARLRSQWRCSAQARTWSQCSHNPAAGPLVQHFCQPNRTPDCSERCQPLRATGASHQHKSSSSGSSRLAAFGRLFRSRYDADIFRLAIPALMSILLDPVMSLVDTGAENAILPRPANCHLALHIWLGGPSGLSIDASMRSARVFCNPNFQEFLGHTAATSPLQTRPTMSNAFLDANIHPNVCLSSSKCLHSDRA